MVLPSYLPKAGQRLGAQYARVGATEQYFEISGARSIVETLNTAQASGLDLVRQLNAEGFEGCWVIGLGTNDTANVYVGSAVDLKPRIDQMMRLMGDQPVMWVTVRSLLNSGPYAEENMERWNQHPGGRLRRIPEHAHLRLGVVDPGRLVYLRRDPLHLGGLQAPRPPDRERRWPTGSPPPGRRKALRASSGNRRVAPERAGML